MNVEKLVSSIKGFLHSNPELSNSPTMYDPDDLDKNMSFAVVNKDKEGVYRKFMVNVKEVGLPSDIEQETNMSEVYHTLFK